MSVILLIVLSIIKIITGDYHMKYLATAVLTLALATFLFAGENEKPMQSTPQFDKMKSLVGTWKGKNDEGKPVTISYKLVSNESSLMETIDVPEHSDDMITMYHLNGRKLMMTHYCSAGNQPRMQVKSPSLADNTLTFSYMDATNLASKNDAHMSKLVVTFKDADHFAQDWTMSENRKEVHHAKFDFERVKP